MSFAKANIILIFIFAEPYSFNSLAGKGKADHKIQLHRVQLNPSRFSVCTLTCDNTFKCDFSAFHCGHILQSL